MMDVALTPSTKCENCYNSAGKLEGGISSKVDPKVWINREKVEYTLQDGGYPLDCL